MCLLPFSRLFDSHLPALLLDSDDSSTALEGEHDNIITADDRHDKQRARMGRDQEGALYNSLNKTQPININNGFVTFCRHFKYLGSFVSFSLCDDFDIEYRVTAATQSMGA